MNYPVWELYGIGGGTLIALIAILHVFISHLAVGGGIFIWLTDRRASKTGDAKLLEYVKSHTWFFLLLTMVFGGISGVGIWFIIALVNPAATSTLIHAFVFGWAIEWVFFIGEVVALLVYHYYFDHLEPRVRTAIAFLYALFAWLSLAVINGILSFMLTPGTWLTTGGFWDGILNPTYLSSTVFRTFIATMMAGLFGYITALRRRDAAFRIRLMRYCSRWLLVSAAGILLSGWWYFKSVPAEIRATTFLVNPDTAAFLTAFMAASAGLVILAALLMLRFSLNLQRATVTLMVLIGLVWIGGFEYMREIARKPFVIHDYMYSNSIKVTDTDMLDTDGILKHAKWVSTHEVTPDNQLNAGKEIFTLQCAGCHTIGGIRNNIAGLIEGYPETGIRALIEGAGKANAYMPIARGTDEEKDALAAYLAYGIGNLASAEKVQEVSIIPHDVTIPPFNASTSEYVLLAWNDLGMHCTSDCDKWFTILPPANTIEAQLLKRGATPVLISDGVAISYSVEPQHQHPEKHSDFWKYSEQTFGKQISPGIGLAGKEISGTMDFDEETSGYIARFVPVSPYRDDGGYNPYPQFTLEARDDSTGKLLAATTVAAPVSTEMGCRNCHGGGWRVNDKVGLSDETAIAILTAHDRLNGTGLLADARAGQPKLCQSCHADPAIGSEGAAGVMSFAAAMHGWHANYMPKKGADACMMCHPSNPIGSTRCQRGVHTAAGLTCVNCHGGLTDHALSLLKAEQAKPAAQRLMKNLKPLLVESIDQINPRTPWLNEPECVSCHVDYQKPADGATSYNHWNSEMADLYRMQTDLAGIRCEACHSSTHAIYFTNNPYGKNLSNTQPMQYMGRPYAIGEGHACVVCHGKSMQDPIHHENMDRQARLRQ